MPSIDPAPAQLARRALAQGLRRRDVLRLAGLTGLGAGGSALLAACGGSDSSSSSGSGGAGGSGGGSFGEIAVQLSWIKNIEFAGEFFADSKGYYKKAGFSKVNLLAGGSAGTSAEAGVTTGKAFAGLSSPSLTAPAILKGAKLKIVGATYQKNPFCIVSLASNPIKSPQDMLGKKIGVQSGGNDTIFAALLKANNIDKSKLTIVPVQYDPTVVATGEVDGFMAYITNEPILLASEGHPVATFLFADNGLPLVTETVTVSTDTIKNDRDKLKAFLLAEVKGWTDALNDPAGGAALAVNTYGKDQKLKLDEQTQEINAQAQLVVSADTQANGIFTMTDQLVQENITSLANAGITITADQLFDLSVIKEVYTANPDLTAGPTVTPSATS
jgi:ABC-type nitrate/sulfonate/bicarbonate transport system substrate-binding protein